MIATKVLQFHTVPYSLKADVDLKRQQKKKEGCGLMIAVAAASLTHSEADRVSITLVLGVPPSKTQPIEPISDLQKRVDSGFGPWNDFEI